MENEYCKVTCSKRLENWPVACGARDLGRLSALRPVLESFGQFSSRLASRSVLEGSGACLGAGNGGAEQGGGTGAEGCASKL